MKKGILFFSILVLTATKMFACDISATISGSKKSTYAVGEEVIIDVQVQLTHRVCPFAIKQTKFTYENLKIVGATEWKETKPGLYTRQVKVIVTADKPGDSKLSVIRKCDKEGGYAVCVIKKS